MDSLVLDFNNDGTVTGLWSDAIDFRELGRVVRVERVSSIEYNPERDEWEVRWTGRADVAFAHKSREECVEWEREAYNEAALVA